MSEPETPAPRFISECARAATIPLEWPIEFGGKVYDKIGIARLTAREVADFHEKMAKRAETDPFTWPVFRDTDGGALPDGLLDALDIDDRDTLDKAALDFLPRRFRGAAKSASEPPTGEPIA